jgi:hypothetical protein
MGDDELASSVGVLVVKHFQTAVSEISMKASMF